MIFKYLILIDVLSNIILLRFMNNFMVINMILEIDTFDSRDLFDPLTQTDPKTCLRIRQMS